MNHQARINRKRKIATLIEEDIGIGKEFTVYTVYQKWNARWGRLPSIKELSKVLPSFRGLDRYRVDSQSNMLYVWTGEYLREGLELTEEEEERKKRQSERKKHKV
jgi:predicted AlkP superfamily phosphohydrolase/phosphomutase